MKTGYITGAKGKIALSKIVLGTSYYGTGINQKDAYALLDKYYLCGGRTLDTARIYGINEAGFSASELTIGEWMSLRGVRSEITLISKGGHPPFGKMDQSRLDRESLHSDCNASLRDLGTDYIDLYFLHRDDERLPVGPIMDALHELVEAGKVRALGASNWRIERILQANAYAKANGKTPFSISQIQWSLAHCTPEAVGDPTLVCMDDAEYSKYLEAGLPVMAFASQAKGLFSKYIAGGEAALNEKIRQRFLTEENLHRIDRVQRLSERTGYSPAAITLSYITCNAVDGYAIVGCSNVDQLMDSLSADLLDLDPDTLLKYD